MENDFDFEIGFCHSILRKVPDDLTVLEMLAGYYTQSGRIDEGLELDHKIVGLDPDNAISHYNLACSLALKNREGDAIAALRTALERGYNDFKWLMDDPDLASLHENPSFSALISEFQVKES